jgi:DNA repair photolyase
LAAIDTLAQAGVPVGVLVAPVIPGLTEHELPAILTAAARVGAQYTGAVTLRLPRGVAALFEDWLHQHAPTKKTKIPQRIRALRGGKLNDARFGVRMHGEGVFADHIAGLFTLGCRKAGWLLLDSRVVDMPMASNPTFVTLSSLKPFFFNGLQNE